jgi:hypothetical protein
VPTMVTLRGSWPSKFIKLAPWVTAKSVYLQHNVMLYIQKSVSENVGNCSHRGRKIQKFSGGEYPRPPPPPTSKCDTTPNFLLPTNHLSFFHTRYSMVPFCKWPPHWQILKKCPGNYQACFFRFSSFISVFTEYLYF